MTKGPLFYVIWTAFGEFPVWDENGQWEKLKNTCSLLKDQGVEIHFSRALPDQYREKPPRNERVVLPEKAREQLKADLIELCQTDRIMQGTVLEGVRVTETSVEVLLHCHPDSLEQKIARLKSRSATLLSFAFRNEFHGKGTWGKGFWTATIFNKETLATSMIAL